MTVPGALGDGCAPWLPPRPGGHDRRPRRPPPPGGGVPAGRVRAFLRLVVIEHSVFALPFAYVAALAASYAHGRSVHWRALALVTVAMVAARTFAMATNRLIDRELDARNPRTASRELVTGAVSVRTATVGSAVALLVFLATAALLSPLCLLLAPVALALLVAYPYGKRFTWACHGLLGLAQAVAPVGAWIAVTGAWSWHAVVLGLAVGLWIGGFDLVYALQDLDSDRSTGVHSLPARFGAAVALRVSEVAHVVTLGLFAWFGALEGFGGWWWAGLAATGAAFAYEHAIVKPDDLSRVDRSFFTANGFVGVALFAFALTDLIARGLTW
ncbi:MAG TPA: menaquinone biosynthesis prenyltransferase MqnP [Frankiaceae bacterium]|nr:menaquinone biosynthesis prenyltransferase MqnP [Frankiaceae bacterium]